MANFDVQDKFNSSKNFRQVKFGENAPLLETELNEMQKIQAEAQAEIVRKTTHSGFLQVGALTFLPTTANTFRMAKQEVNVNGYIFEIPQTDVVLPEPPTTGERDDFIFLEAWFEEITAAKDSSLVDSRVREETSRRVKLNYQIRVVEDVDFIKYPTGFSASGTALGGLALNNPKVINYLATMNGRVAQEGTVALYGFRSSAQRKPNPYPYNQFPDDVGLYLSGTGTDSTYAPTVDKLAYAIPMFRVKRRNSGGFSAENFNGSNSILPLFNFVTANATPAYTVTTVDQMYTYTVSAEFYDKVSVGDYLSYMGMDRFSYVVVSKQPTNKVTIKALLTGSGGGNFSIKNSRPGNAYSDVIYQDDIIDLRHKVSLTGFDYQNLLEEGFDKLLRGELITKEPKKLLKTYHGIRKTPIDANTVFYASLDGQDTAEVGGGVVQNLGNISYLPTPTGLGIVAKNVNPYNAPRRFNAPANIGKLITIDCTVRILETVSSFGYSPFMLRGTGDTIMGHGRIELVPNTSTMRLVNGGSGITLINDTAFHHLRAVYNLTTKTVTVYVDGQLKGTAPVLYDGLTDFNVQFVEYGGVGLLVSDLAISNIDRGVNFATLPKDFIDGYARIMPAFNGQRRNFSDAQMATPVTSIARPKALTSTRGITVVKGSGNTDNSLWQTGDQIKVKGVGGELIMGLIDTDTALARVVSYGDGSVNGASTSSTSEFILDNVSKLSVGDTIRIALSSSLSMYPEERTITAINSAEKKITLNSGASVNINAEVFIVETTTTSSSPIAKFANGNTSANVNGTWTGLGTNEATLTITSTANLDTDDVHLQYTLVTPSGQGGIPEVLTEVLSGEFNGKNYVKGQALIRANFKNKTVGNISTNPHLFYTGNLASLVPNPSTTSSLVEVGGTDLSVQGGNTIITNPSGKGLISQHIFRFNLVAEFERRFGAIHGSTVADKVMWLKANIKTINFNWVGRGTSPLNNNVKMTHWNFNNNVWATNLATTHSSTSISTLSRSLTGIDNVSSLIGEDGYVSYVAYNDSTNANTANNILETDYVELEITLSVPNGYESIAPQNTFYDGSKGNILFVRKETKEIETLFHASNDDDIVTLGQYAPLQALAPHTGKSYFVTPPKCGIVMSLPSRPPTTSVRATNVTQLPVTPTNLLSARWSSAREYLPIRLHALQVEDVVISSIMGESFNLTAPPSGSVFSSSVIMDYDRITGKRLFFVVESAEYLYGSIGVAYALFRSNGRLQMLVYSAIVTPDTADTNGTLYRIPHTTTTSIAVYDLPNRPLIKEV